MSDARMLDERFLAIVADWAAGGAGCDEATFDALARDLFAYQVARNAAYARFAAALGFGADRLPAHWSEIPAVPTAAFKDATLATFDPSRAERVFHTSGTTAQRSGRHYVARLALYDAALLAAFDRFMLADGARLRYLLLVPDPRRNPHSSLGYMMERVAEARGDGRTGWFLQAERIAAEAFARAMRDAADQRQPVCVATTAFALVALLDALEGMGVRLAAAPGSRLMETGGFKGRSRTVERADLYRRTSRTLGIPEASIVAEYGMTELLSQYYDAPDSRGSRDRRKVGPPWLRACVVDASGQEIAVPHRIGYLRHVDLANRSSVLALQTEDRASFVDGGFVLIGRDAAAEPRGCSLDDEELLAARR